MHKIVDRINYQITESDRGCQVQFPILMSSLPEQGSKSLIQNTTIMTP